MKPKTYTFEELKEFILSRDDDKLVNMDQTRKDLIDAGDTYCGCVLVQFFRKKFKNTVKHVGYSTGCLLKNNKSYTVSPENNTDNANSICRFILRLVDLKPKTYKEVKKNLNQFS